MALQLSNGVLGFLLSSPLQQTAFPKQQDLTAARRFDGDFWTKPRSSKNGGISFPFITTCVLVGSSFDVKEGCNASVFLLPFNMAFDDGGDNNDGITVIDITDVTHVRYYFVIWGECAYVRGENTEEEVDEDQASGPESVLQLISLSRLAYLLAYCNAEERGKRTNFKILIQQHEEWDLVDVASLANTWPKGKWLVRETEAVVDADISRTARPAPSLREAAQARLVDTSLQNPEPDPLWITETELLPDFLPAIKAHKSNFWSQLSR